MRRNQLDKHNVLITTPQPLRADVLSEEALAELRRFAHVTLNEDGRNWTAQEIGEKLPGNEAMLASWDLTQIRLTSDVLAGADRLRIIAYAAGSVKPWITEAVYERGIVVAHAASRIADSVAEYTLLLALLGLRRPHDIGRGIQSGTPQTGRGLPTYDLAGKKIGLLGMGYVGQRTASLFRAVGAEVWAYDPYLPSERAAELGIRTAKLEELLAQCKVVSVHLPSTEETHHMLGARQLALIRDGAIFINTARPWVVDQEALIKELATGRFWAALDVTEPDPAPPDHPLRRMDNVFYTPHIAGPTTEARRELMGLMIGEVKRFFDGQPLQFQITLEKLAIMA
jgi:phosphoglycerate dehydrogenase-like enzyme